MSARAIRKLREDREAALAAAAAEDEDSDESEEEIPSSKKPAKSAFALMNDSSSSDEEEEDSMASDNGDKEEKETAPELKPETAGEEKEEKEEETNEENEKQQEENLDALLEEFKEQDDKKQSSSGLGAGDAADGVESSAVPSFLLQGMDVRDLDVDFVMRASLLSAEPPTESSGNNNKPKRRNRQTFLFGNPRDLNVNVKPPHFVGGGIGMTTYNDDNRENDERSIPWPYNKPEITEMGQDRKQWYTFIHSDSYNKDCKDCKLIQNSGDMNGLAWFVAHHPFVTDALLTLGKMLYHTNQAQEGLTFLRRSMWVYESATLAGFTSRVFEDQCFMDFVQPENQTYFNALFQLARVNSIAGLPRSSFAIGRYLLSLDPLRDPRGILLALDSYALSVAGEGNDRWLVDLCESKKVQIHYRDGASDDANKYQCDLTDLPNWSYSYALALFRINDSRPSEVANRALKTAIRRFPGVVDLLLSENDVDITSRSCRLDWQAVMDYTGSRANAIHGSPAMDALDPVVRMATEKAHELITRIFAKLSHKLWASDAVMLWVHNNLKELKSESSNIDNENSTIDEEQVVPLSPALMRYSRIDPGEYEMKFQLLPAEANPLDPRVVQHALVIDPNRRRFIRNQQQRGGRGNPMNEDFLFGGGQGAVRPRTLLGPPSNVIDLDWPMLEIFWRSLLPWNRIDEIPRPRP